MEDNIKDDNNANLNDKVKELFEISAEKKKELDLIYTEFKSLKSKLEDEDEILALKNNDLYREVESFTLANYIINKELYTIITTYTYTDFNKLISNMESFIEKSKLNIAQFQDLINKYNSSDNSGLEDFKNNLVVDQNNFSYYEKTFLSLINRFNQFELEKSKELLELELTIQSVRKYFNEALNINSLNEISEYKNTSKNLFDILEQNLDLTKVSLNKDIENLSNHLENEITENYHNIVKSANKKIISQADDLFVQFHNLRKETENMIIGVDVVNKYRQINSSLESLTQEQ